MSSNSCSRFRKSNWHSKIHVIGGPDVLVKMGKLKKSLISASSNVLLFTFALVVRDNFHAGGAECIDITYRRVRLIYKYSIYLQLYSQIMPDQLILHSFFQLQEVVQQYSTRRWAPLHPVNIHTRLILINILF
ncbi:hypothetical protein BD777DRAFT_45037 [Yarrowia lipolytica]|nr:hypothetical protein BD777DRAFT_45037 [Yarrowia lipolytica]